MKARLATAESSVRYPEQPSQMNSAAFFLSNSDFSSAEASASDANCVGTKVGFQI